MKYHVKRWISILLTLCMMLGMLPIPAIAAELSQPISAILAANSQVLYAEGQDLSLFRLYSNKGAAAVSHLCEDDGVYTSVSFPDQVVLSGLTPASTTQDGSVHAACTKCGKEANLVIPKLETRFFQQIKNGEDNNIYNGKRHDVRLSIAEGTVAATDGRVYSYSDLLYSVWIIGDSNITDAGSYRFGYQNGAQDGQWDGTSLYYQDAGSFWFDEFTYEISPMVVEATFPYGIEHPIAWEEDLIHTIEKPTYKDAFGETKECLVDFYNIDYEVSGGSWRFKDIDLDNEGPVTALPVGIYGALYTPQSDLHQNDDGTTVPVLNYEISFNGSSYRGVMAALYVAPTSLRDIFVNDAGDDLMYDPVFVPDMYSAIMGEDVTGAGAPIEGYEKISDRDLWKITLDPKTSGADKTALNTAGTVPAILYAHRTDHDEAEAPILFNNGNMTITIKKRALQGTNSPYHVILPLDFEVTPSVFAGANTVDIWAEKNTSVLDSDSSKLIKSIPVTWDIDAIDTSRIGYQVVTGTLDWSLISREVHNPNSVPIITDACIVSSERQKNRPPAPVMESHTATTITLQPIDCLVDVDSLTFSSVAEKELVRKDHTIVYGILFTDENGQSQWQWQYTNVFRGLQPNTEYTFATRFEHEPFLDSPPTTTSQAQKFSTLERGESLANTILYATADEFFVYYGDVITLCADIDGGEKDGNTYRYSWFKLDEDGEHYISEGRLLEIKNIDDSGLYFARAIVQDADGSVTVDSNIVEVYISRNRLLGDDAFANITSSDITYGEPLSASTLSTKDGRALGTYGGTFEWQNPTEYLTAGTHTVGVLFTPYSIVNYAPQIINVDVHVEKAVLNIKTPDQTVSYGFENTPDVFWGHGTITADAVGLNNTNSAIYTSWLTLNNAQRQKVLIQTLSTCEISGFKDATVTGREEDLSVLHGYLGYVINCPDFDETFLSTGSYSYTLAPEFSIAQVEPDQDTGKTSIEADNYRVVCTPGTLTVKKLDAEFTLSGITTKQWGAGEPEYAWTTTDGVKEILGKDGITLGSSTKEGILSPSRDTGEEPGVYPIYLAYNGVALGTRAADNSDNALPLTPDNFGDPDVKKFVQNYNIHLAAAPAGAGNTPWPFETQVETGGATVFQITKKVVSVSYDGPLQVRYDGTLKFDKSKLHALDNNNQPLPLDISKVEYYVEKSQLISTLTEDKIIDPGYYIIYFTIPDENLAKYYQPDVLPFQIDFYDIPTVKFDPVEYGTTLSAMAFPAWTIGSMAWQNPSQVLTPGIHQVEAVFTPSPDAPANAVINYEKCEGYDAETGTLVKTIPLTITKRLALDVEALEVLQRKVYDGTTAAAILGDPTVRILEDDDVEASVSAVYERKDTGTDNPISVRFTLTGTAADRYTVPEDYQLDGEISPAPLIIRVNDLDVMYGYDVAEVLGTCRVTVNGLAQGETLADLEGTPVFTTPYENLADIPARGADITVSGYTSPNYDISYLPGKLNIAKLPVSAGVVSPAKVYGEDDPELELVYEIHGQEGKTPVSGLDDVIRSELRRMVTSREDGEELGTYEYTYAFPPSSNFEFSPIPASLSIGQVVADVVWTGLDGTYKADGTDQGSKIKAQYDNNGIMEDLTVTFQDSEGRAARFQEPGVYTAVASSGSDAIALHNATKTVRMYEPDPVAPDAPEAPVMVSSTETSITLAAIDGVSYSMDGGKTWQTNPTFSGLKPNTEYSFIARAERDGLYSDPSPSATYKTQTPQDTRGDVGTPVLDTKTQTSISVKPKANAEYSIDNGNTWQGTPVFNDLTPNTSYSIIQRWIAAGELPAGTPSSALQVTTDPEDAPVVPNAPEVVHKGRDRIFLKLIEGMEYSIDGGKTWTDSPAFTDLQPGTTYSFIQRVKAVNGGQPGPVSEPLNVTTDFDQQIIDERGTIPAVRIRNITDVRIIFEFVIGAEYSINGGQTWQDSTSFDGLTPETTYQCTQRWRKTDKLPEGAPAAIVPVTTEPGVVVDNRPALSAPMVTYKNATQVILQAIDGVEYTKDRGATWQNSPVFSGLTPNTEYYFQQRYQKTNTLPVGPTTSGVLVKTDAEIVSPPDDNRGNVGIPKVQLRTSRSITLVFVKGAEYSRDGGRTWQASSHFSGLQPNTSYSFVQRWAAAADLPAGPVSEALSARTQAESTPITPPVGPDDPNPPVDPDPPADHRGNIPAVEVMAKGTTYITLKPVVDAEYSIDNGRTWQDSSTFSNLQAGTTYVVAQRWKAKGQLAAGTPVSLSVSTDQVSTPVNPENPGNNQNPSNPNPVKTLPKRASGNGFHDVVTSKNTVKRPTIHIQNTVVPIANAGAVQSEANCQSQGFVDIDHSAWYHRAIDFNMANGFMIGTSATTWSPNTNITRAQFTQVLYRLAGKPSGYTLSGKTDVQEGAWFYDAAAWAYGVGITGGTTDTTFSPNEELTFSQLACMVYRFCTAYGIACTTAEIPTAYDVSSVPGYATAAMQAIAQTGVFNIQGVTSVSPNTVVTRVQTAQIMVNICSQFNQQLFNNEVLQVPAKLFSSTFNMLTAVI